jgi:3'(2'), 5'-bisphosphate nucleotidase
MIERSNLEKYISTAIDAAYAASEEILRIYNTGDWNVEMKSDSSPLTLADRAAHAVIEKILLPLGLPVLSEEGKNIPFEERKSWNLFWMVDPLDGTKEFIKRNGEFTVNIALISDGRPVWGVVLAPVLKKCYYLDVENIGWLEIDRVRNQLTKRTTHLSFAKEGIRVVASRSHASPETTSFIEQLKDPKLVSMGSSLKFMMLAEGVADVYPRFAPTMEWDTAAAHAILNGLGYKVLQHDSDNELQYNKSDLLNPWFIAK